MHITSSFHQSQSVTVVLAPGHEIPSFITNTRKVPILWMEMTKISHHDLSCFFSLFVPCHIPDAWAYRAQNEGEKMERKGKGLGHGFTDLT